MMLKFILLGITFVEIVFFIKHILPELKREYRDNKELKQMIKKQQVFRYKMSELEIK